MLKLRTLLFMFFFSSLCVCWAFFFWLLCSFLVPQLSSWSPSQPSHYEIFFLLLPVTGDQIISTHPQMKAARCVCLVEILQQQSPPIQAKDTHNPVKSINVLKHCESKGFSIRRAVSVFQEKLLLIFWTGRNPIIWSFQSDDDLQNQVKIQSTKAQMASDRYM